MTNNIIDARGMFRRTRPESVSGGVAATNQISIGPDGMRCGTEDKIVDRVTLSDGTTIVFSNMSAPYAHHTLG